MESVEDKPRTNKTRAACSWFLALAALAIAMAGARDFAGGWNDGSRLATVEAIVDYHTLSIDQSIFVRVPAPGQGPLPYPSDEALLLQRGTGDKLLINGHFYSDKSPVPAVFLASLYQLLRWTAGLKASLRPDLFCYWMTVGSSGLAYVLAVTGMLQIGMAVGLSLSLSLLLACSMGFSTIALTYSRQVNNHILLLALVTMLLLLWFRIRSAYPLEINRTTPLLGLGTLVGIGYTIDLGAGPLLMLGTTILVAFRYRKIRPIMLLLLAALPWLALHHALNYSIGGTFAPANAITAYLEYPGSAFNAQNMTGHWQHRSLWDFAVYAVALLFGKRGFFGHNLPLFLTIIGGGILMRRRNLAERVELIWAVGWSLATWLLYATTSNNYSGVCASIRWFVPLLAPAYLLLALLLREYPEKRFDLILLSTWGAILAAIMWWQGPWLNRMVPFFWPIQAVALLSWIFCARWRQRTAENRRDTKTQSN